MALSAERLGGALPTGIGTTTTFVAVASGRRVILRDLRIATAAGTTGVSRVVIQKLGSSNKMEILNVSHGVVTAYAHLLDAFIVLDATDELQAITPVGHSVNVWASGHNFALP